MHKNLPILGFFILFIIVLKLPHRLSPMIHNNIGISLSFLTSEPETKKIMGRYHPQSKKM